MRQIIYEMRLHKLRSFLAVFCISFGTLTVVLLLALGTGFHDASLRNMMDIVDGSFFIWQGKMTRSQHGFPRGQDSNIMIDTVVDLPKIFPTVQACSPWMMKPAILSYGGKAYTKAVHGVGPDYALLRKVSLIEGSRFISAYDIKHQARVVVIGDKLKNILLKNKNALGTKILINNVPFTVIGVLPKAQENKHNFYDDAAIISYESYVALYGDRFVMNFIVMPNPDVNPLQFEQSLRSYFSQKYHFDKNDKEALHIFNTSKIFQFMRWFFIAIQIFLGACGAMTLAVGSIGVANIMFLIVTERTREIGLRKAIGATDRNILLQLLLEALVVVGVGGGFGFLVALVTIVILQHVPLPDWLGAPILSGTTTIATITILALIGLIAGFFPARKAAKMDPIDALAL